MDELSLQVLKLFIAMGAESLDPQTLFEAGANDPAARQRVLYAVTRLADTGYLESRGSDFCLLTDKGRRAAKWRVGIQSDSAPDAPQALEGEWQKDFRSALRPITPGWSSQRLPIPPREWCFRNLAHHCPDAQVSFVGQAGLRSGDATSLRGRLEN